MLEGIRFPSDCPCVRYMLPSTHGLQRFAVMHFELSSAFALSAGTEPHSETMQRKRPESLAYPQHGIDCDSKGTGMVNAAMCRG
jgi:hypothetical protein